MKNTQTFVPGTIVQHFKRTLLDENTLKKQPLMYLYEIIGSATDTETEAEVMVYRALYGTRQMYVRPLEMFLSPVDREKYPNAGQIYRFETVK